MFCEELLTNIKRHALRMTPLECCGLLISRDCSIISMESENVSRVNKEKTFEINPRTYLQATSVGEIVGYYHSHNSPSTNTVFSETDVNNLKIHGLISIIYNTVQNQFYFLTDLRKQRYIGRVFKLGKNDCFSLIRDYYQQELSIRLGDYERDSKWFIKSPRLWLDNFEREGGVIVHRGNSFDFKLLKPHDVILMDYKTSINPSHGAIYVGDGMVLHHPALKLSTIEPLCGDLLARTRYVIRHKQLS